MKKHEFKNCTSATCPNNKTGIGTDNLCNCTKSEETVSVEDTVISESERLSLTLPEYSCVSIYEVYTYLSARQIGAEILTAWKVGRSICYKIKSKKGKS